MFDFQPPVTKYPLHFGFHLQFRMCPLLVRFTPAMYNVSAMCWISTCCLPSACIMLYFHIPFAVCLHHVGFFPCIFMVSATSWISTAISNLYVISLISYCFIHNSLSCWNSTCSLDCFWYRLDFPPAYTMCQFQDGFLPAVYNVSPMCCISTFSLQCVACSMLDLLQLHAKFLSMLDFHLHFMLHELQFEFPLATFSVCSLWIGT